MISHQDNNRIIALEEAMAVLRGLGYLEGVDGEIEQTIGKTKRYLEDLQASHAQMREEMKILREEMAVLREEVGEIKNRRGPGRPPKDRAA